MTCQCRSICFSINRSLVIFSTVWPNVVADDDVADAFVPVKKGPALFGGRETKKQPGRCQPDFGLFLFHLRPSKSFLLSFFFRKCLLKTFDQKGSILNVRWSDSGSSLSEPFRSFPPVRWKTFFSHMGKKIKRYREVFKWIWKDINFWRR